MQFKNTVNGHIVKFNRWTDFFACLFFGPLYFLLRGHIVHALISILAAFLTAGISWFIYPFFTETINENAYLNKGWVRLETN